MANLPNRLVSVPGASNFLATREEYIAICNGDTCAAALLGFLESFSVWRLESGYAGWEWCAFTQQDFVERLHHTWGLSKVKQRLAWLREMGYIEARHNEAYKYDRRTQYRFAAPVVQAAIDYWWAGESAGEMQPIEALETTNRSVENNQSISRKQLMDQSKTTNRLVENDQSDSLDINTENPSLDRDVLESSSSSTRAPAHAQSDDDDDPNTRLPDDSSSKAKAQNVLPFRQLLAAAKRANPSPPSSALPPLRSGAKSAAVAAYEADIGRAGDTVLLEIEQAVLQLGEPVVIEAIKKAAQYGAKSWAYVRAMLVDGHDKSGADRSAYIGGQYADWVVH